MRGTNQTATAGGEGSDLIAWGKLCNATSTKLQSGMHDITSGALSNVYAHLQRAKATTGSTVGGGKQAGTFDRTGPFQESPGF